MEQYTSKYVVFGCSNRWQWALEGNKAGKGSLGTGLGMVLLYSFVRESLAEKVMVGGKNRV